MAGQPVLPKGSPPPLAPYSPGFRSGQFVCTSGASAVPKVRVNGRSEDVIFFDGVFFESSLKSIFFAS